MRRIIIKGLKQITSTSPRFKKFLSPLISLNFRRNFTKCVIKCAMCIISKNPIESFSIHPSGPWWYKNFAWAVSWSLKRYQNAGRFFKCTKNISYRHLQEKSAREILPFGFQITMAKYFLKFIKPFSQWLFQSEAMSGCQNKRSILNGTSVP